MLAVVHASRLWFPFLMGLPMMLCFLGSNGEPGSGVVVPVGSGACINFIGV